MATCAPPALFFPMTDILNVALVQSSERFHIGELTAVGKSVSFPGFATSVDRPGLAMTESSDGGVIALTDVSGGRAIVTWTPTPSQLHLVQQVGAAGAGQSVTLDGTERFAFRLEIDARSGVLERATTLYDDLDVAMTMADLPADQHPHMHIQRQVTIARIRP
jgi:hypothetical protein